jgi:predicted ATP-dependent protease
LPAEIAAFLARMGAREALKPVDRDGVAALIETAVRRAGNGPRVSLAFGALADLYRESDYLADGAVVGRADVRAALRARAERHGSSMRLAREAVMDGQLHIATSGAIVGQVNGLAVHDAGGHTWGHPLRITATVGAARAPGIVHIDREAGLSGASHDKGVQVLVGWLLGRFGRARVLTLRAHLAIEQSHFFIDGDSASAAELIALLSAVSGLPVRQDCAITGAVDQLGGLRPIGGVNEKIEGFHRLVLDRGADACPGVVVPLHNVGDLALDEDVIAAVADGRFAVWAAASLEEAAEVLFGRPFADVCAAVEAALDALAVVAFRRPPAAPPAAAEE